MFDALSVGNGFMPFPSFLVGGSLRFSALLVFIGWPGIVSPNLRVHAPFGAVDTWFIFSRVERLVGKNFTFVSLTWLWWISAAVFRRRLRILVEMDSW
jgi:hypothetical protein